MSKTTPLMDWEDKDTGDIVQTTRSFLFREIANKMFSIFVMLGHDVKEERLDVVVQCLAAEEQLRKKT